MSMTEPIGHADGRPTMLEPQPAPRRRLSSRVSLLHVIAAVSGLLAFLLILSWMRGQQDLVEAAVAGVDIPAGNVVSVEMFDFVEVPADGAFGGKVLTRDEVNALLAGPRPVATRRIGAEEPILATDFRSADMPVGLRAMSLPVDLNRAVGGALAASDRVDVIGFDGGGPFYIATDVVVLDVPVASAGAFGTSTGYAITLAVTDEQALMLAEALTEGEIHVLRSTGAPEVTLERLLPASPQDGIAERREGEAGGDRR